MPHCTFSRVRRSALAALTLALALGLAGCDDDDGNGIVDPTDPGTGRMYNQVQRLGNPLVSEALLEKRDHPLHGTIGPDQDVALIAAKVKAFLTGVAGRDPAYADAVTGVLVPDVLVVQTDRDPANSGWLTWLNLGPFTGGWGGRTLPDDVVDVTLLAGFGDPFGLDPQGAAGKERLTSDNVPFNPATAQPGFPYLTDPY